MGISILVTIEGLGGLDGLFGLRRIGRRNGIAASGGRQTARRGNASPLLLFRWIHQLCVMFGGGSRRVGIVPRCFGDMPAYIMCRDSFRAVCNRAFRQTGW
jgi:hypothetical protein